jgi:hypothetical protein
MSRGLTPSIREAETLVAPYVPNAGTESVRPQSPDAFTSPDEIMQFFLAQCSPYGHPAAIGFFCSRSDELLCIVKMNDAAAATNAAAALRANAFAMNDDVCATVALTSAFSCPGRSSGEVGKVRCSDCRRSFKA